MQCVFLPADGEGTEKARCAESKEIKVNILLYSFFTCTLGASMPPLQPCSPFSLGVSFSRVSFGWGKGGEEGRG